MKVLIYSDMHYGKDGDRTNRIIKKFFRGISSIEFDVAINCGDSISDDGKQISRFMELQRKYIKQPIVQCLGNHSLWGSAKYDSNWYEDRINMWKEEFKKHDVTHVSECKEIGGFRFVGIDGWYGINGVKNFTNDYAWMNKTLNGRDTHCELRDRAQQDLDVLLEKKFPKEKTIYITHFSPFLDSINDRPFSADSAMAETLIDNFKWICVGHSHRYKNEIVNGTTILNCGSDYNEPKFVMLEMS